MSRLLFRGAWMRREGERGMEGFVFEIRDLFIDCGKGNNREGEVEDIGERRNDQGSAVPKRGRIGARKG